MLQSALAEHLYDKGEASSEKGDAAGHSKMQALAAVAKRFEKLRRGDPHPPAPTPTDAESHAAKSESCAHIVVELVFGGVRERINAAVELSPFGHCDPHWLATVTQYYKHLWFGGKIPYIPPAGASDSVFDTLPERCRLGIIGDWGTGTETAQKVLAQVQKYRAEVPDVPFIVLHLGDVYYSGSAKEYERFIARIRLGFPSEPIFTLSGNHDMYSGGAAYYKCIAALNAPPNTQKTSFFSLRNRYWQFQAMDTGLHDHDPFDEGSYLTFLDPAEVTWQRQQLSDAGQRKVVLLSHHQPFSAFGHLGKTRQKQDVFVNRHLIGTVDGAGPDAAGENFLPRVSLWLFGHEHNTIVYEPYAGAQRARCVGSSAIPADATDGDPYRVAEPGIPWKHEVKLSITGGFYNHGFAVMDLDGPKGSIAYYQYPAEGGNELLFKEEL
jgi:hypothetical protein